MSAPSKLSVLVVCDRPISLRGIASLIAESDELELVGTATDALSGYRKSQDVRPALMVIQSPLADLFRALITPDSYVPRVVLLGNTPSPSIRCASNSDWVCAYLPPEVGLGKAHLDMLTVARCPKPKVDSRGCAECTAHHTLDMPALSISGRELEVFMRIGNGEGASQIADAMGVSVKTVETYRENIKHKLGLGSAHQLSAAAIHWREGEGALDVLE